MFIHFPKLLIQGRIIRRYMQDSFFNMNCGLILVKQYNKRLVIANLIWNLQQQQIQIFFTVSESC